MQSSETSAGELIVKTTKRKTLSACLGLAGSGLFAAAANPVAAGAATLDQSYAPASFPSGYSFLTAQGSTTNWQGETFTAGLSGLLSQLVLPVWQDPAYATGVKLDVFSYSGTSLGTLLGTITVPSSAVPDGQGGGAAWPPPSTPPFAFSVNLASLGIDLAAGSQYAIAASATVPYPAGKGGNGIVWLGSNPAGPDNYTGGHEFFAAANTLSSSTHLATVGPTVDLGFQEFVIPTAVPEPSVAWMLVGGLAVIGAVAGRRRITPVGDSSPAA
jgi:hypothetical protein